MRVRVIICSGRSEYRSPKPRRSPSNHCGGISLTNRKWET